MQYKKINNYTGLAVLILATIVYALTVEPTASFWDCSEFIATAFKLEVPHPSGAPFFLMVARMFSFLSLGDLTKVAYWINWVSILSSGLTIMFTFWSITLLGRKMFKVKQGEETPAQIIALMGAGVVGAFSLCFADSFWWSAVEAEVYAMSSFLTALTVWAMLKWDTITIESEENRWLILIAYIIGIAIGVHLLNIVSLPALALIYYFKKYKNPNWKGFLAAFAIGGVILMLIWQFTILGLPEIASRFEIFFVNGLGLPFGSGALFFVIIFFGAMAYGVYYTHKKQKVMWNTVLLAFTFIIIGYSSYITIIIRSKYNPPIDENNPEDAMSFISYLKREQYGSRPLLYGPYFTAKRTGQEKGAPIYTKGKDKYEITDYQLKDEYDPTQETILPRMYSHAPGHAAEYRRWVNLKPGEKPTFGDNIEFMLKYQLGHMYLRYFLWNFAGRESDIDDAGWLSPFEDLGHHVPDLLKNNKGRNNFYMIPLILGIVGLFFQYNRDKKGFAFTGMLFFLMGIALVLYLNSPATEPRERDYIYVGSYYAFAFWIGFGTLALFSGLQKLFKNPKGAAATACIIAVLAPGIMAAQGWDDHDRSDRFFSVDAARNYLASCAPNAILFTGGDNDTFPLWYVQEVEGFRTDVRVVVLSYFNTDWYIDQMKRQAYKSDPLPITLKHSQYIQGGPNDYLPVVNNPNIKGAINLKQYIHLIEQNHPALQVPTQLGSYNSVPAKTFALNIDTARIKKMGIIPDNLKDDIVPRMVWNVKGNGLEKKDLMILDLIVGSNWKRPIYFNNTSLNTVNMDLKNYVVQEGLTYRLLPVQSKSKNEMIDVKGMYDNVMQKFRFRNLDDPNVYYNENYRNFVMNHRAALNSLARGLITQNELQKADSVLNYSLDKMPNDPVPYDIMNLETADMLFTVGDDDRAMKMLKTMWDYNRDFFTYINENNKPYLSRERQISFTIMAQTVEILRRHNKTDQAMTYQEDLRKIYKSL